MKWALFLEKVTFLQRSEDMSQIYLRERIPGPGTACAKPENGDMPGMSEQKPGGHVLRRSEVSGRRMIEESDEVGLHSVGLQWTLCEMPSFGGSSVEK